jgi:hypothetical protein
LETHPGPLVVPVLVITEVAHLLGTRLGVEPEVRFLGDLAAGAFTVAPVVASDWLRIAELVATNRGLPLGTVDASVVGDELPEGREFERDWFAAHTSETVTTTDLWAARKSAGQAGEGWIASQAGSHRRSGVGSPR